MSLTDWLHTTLVAMVSRGKVQGSARGKIRNVVQLQLLNGEVRNNVEYMMPFGRSALPSGGDAIMLTVGGTRDDVVAIAVDDPAKRIRGLAPGEFGDSDGQSAIVFKANQLQVQSTQPIAMQSDATIYVTAAAVAMGAVGATLYRMMNELMIPVFNNHVHSGVQSGGSNTGVPTTTLSAGTHTTTTAKAS
jgi:phage gp45-like